LIQPCAELWRLTESGQLRALARLLITGIVYFLR
jgi:hypothetical protein